MCDRCEAERATREPDSKVPFNPNLTNRVEVAGQARDYSSSSLRDKIMHDINRKRNDAMMTVGQCNDLEKDLNDETVKRVLRVLSIG